MSDIFPAPHVHRWWLWSASARTDTGGVISRFLCGDRKCRATWIVGRSR